MAWMRNKTFQRWIGGGFLERLGIRIWSYFMLLSLIARKEKSDLTVVRQVFRDHRSIMTIDEMWLLYAIARSQLKLPGAIAEVGVFRGGSAKIFCELKGERPLHLFDTYEGLPPSSPADGGVHRVGQYACTLDSVKEYLRAYPNLHFHKGLFPDSTTGVPEERYCLANFDVDLYAGTLACLEYFYPRMIPGGIMISHDYDLLAGVRQAFAEFLSDKPEGLIELSTTQCMVVKLP